MRDFMNKYGTGVMIVGFVILCIVYGLACDHFEEKPDPDDQISEFDQGYEMGYQSGIDDREHNEELRREGWNDAIEYIEDSGIAWAYECLDNIGDHVNGVQWQSPEDLERALNDLYSFLDTVEHAEYR